MGGIRFTAKADGAKSDAGPPTLAQLVAMTSEQQEGVDIALMNLRCADEARDGREGATAVFCQRPNG